MLAVALLPQRGMAQVFATNTGVDTLTLADRISIHTNVVDWTLLVPNIGVEFDVRNTNWNRWAVGASFKTRWQTSSTFKQRLFYSLTDARVYYRNYWRSRQIDPRKGVERHSNIIDRLFSCRRSKVKHPHTTYYRGLYASYSNFSILPPKWLAENGRQGNAFSAGVTYGIIKPLYQFASGNSLDLEMGIDVGVVMAQVEKFHVDQDDKCYVRTTEKENKLVPFPVPTEARLGLVYRLGKYPITKKYRWRADVDVQYMEKLLDERTRRDSIDRARKDNAETRRMLEADFFSIYDSVANNNAINAKKMAAEQARMKAEAERAAAEKERADKAEAKRLREMEKNAADSTANAPADSALAVPTDSITTVPTDSITTVPTDSTVINNEPADTTVTNNSGTEVTTEEKPAEEQTTTTEAEATTEEKPAEEQTAEEQTTEQQPAEATEGKEESNENE